MKKVNTWLLIILVTFFACNSDSTPELKLKNYIKARFSGGMDKEDVLSYLSGPFYQFVNDMDEEAFANFTDLKGLKLNFIKVIDSKCEQGKCFITYIIDYSTAGEANKVDFQTQVKKVAELYQEEDQWKIFKIDNLKTLHKAKKPIDITN